MVLPEPVLPLAAMSRRAPVRPRDNARERETAPQWALGELDSEAKHLQYLQQLSKVDAGLATVT